MTAGLTVTACALVAALVTVPLARRWALRGGVMDMPNERSSHAVPTPRTGGVGIVAGTLAGLVAAIFVGQGPVPAELIVSLVVALALASIGLADDVWQLSAGKRMSLYLLGAIVIGFFSYRVLVIELPLLPVLDLGRAGSIVFTALFVGWYTNLFNFMDGIDGIAAGAGIVTCSALAIAFVRNDAEPLLLVSLSLTASAAGFLVYNYSPASIFMGDVGSVFLGAACGALTAAAVELRYLSLVAGVLLMFPFVFDASFTLARRAVRREKVWRPHRTHVYQQMCDLGMGHRGISTLYTVAAAVCAAGGLYYDSLGPVSQLVLVGGALSCGALAAGFVLNKNKV